MNEHRDIIQSHYHSIHREYLVEGLDVAGSGYERKEKQHCREENREVLKEKKVSVNKGCYCTHVYNQNQLFLAMERW